MVEVNSKTNLNGIPWHIVEEKIADEIIWLKKIISLPQRQDKESPITCLDCIYRRIAILIINGYVKAKEFNGKKLWGDFNMQNINAAHAHHGKEWHRKMMGIVKQYFESEGYNITETPKLNYGEADLLISDIERATFIEVGTVSPYKLLFNLETMVGNDIILVPRENQIIELQIIKGNYPIR